MILISCDDRSTFGGHCKVTNEELRDMSLFNDNPDFHRSKSPNPEIKFNFWCSTLNPDATMLSIFKNKFKQTKSCDHALMIQAKLPPNTMNQYLLKYERFSKYDKIHMEERKEYRAFTNQLSIYELELQGKNHKKFLQVDIGTNNCNATIMLTKTELQGDDHEIIQTLKGFSKQNIKLDQANDILAWKTMQYSTSGMLNDHISVSIPLVDFNNILSNRRFYVTMFSKSYCKLGISAHGKDKDPKVIPEIAAPTTKKIKIHKFGRYGIYFRPGMREITVEYLF